MLNWFILSIVATILFGIQAFLYKVGAKKNFDKFEVIFSFTLTAAVISLIMFLFKPASISIKLIFILGTLYGIFFFLKTVGQMQALKYLPTNIVFPITSSNIALVIILALIFLKETLTLLQIIGIVLILFVIISFYTEKQGKIKKGYFKLSFLIAVLAMIFSAAASFTNKIAATNVNKELFITISYFVSAILAGGFKLSKKREIINKKALKLGVVIGIINFIGFYVLLQALSVGPLSIISPIISLYVLIAVILGYSIHKEELTTKRIFLILLSIIAVILLGI